jgi:hypothetical protein
MDNPNIFRTLLSILPQDAVNVLFKSTPTLNERVREIEYDNYYWLLRLENEFNITIPIDQYEEEWYDVYYAIKDQGYSYLFFSGNVNLIRIGLLNCLDPSVHNNQAIINAVYEGRDDIVELLLTDKRVDPSAQKNEALVLACTNGDERIVLLLLQNNRVNPSDQNSKALLQAVKNNHANIVEILLKDGRADPSANSNLPIKVASRGGNINVVKLLLQDNRADPSADNNSALTLALKYNRQDVADLLLTDDRVRL